MASERKGHPSPKSEFSILVPTAPASTTLPAASPHRIVETTGRCRVVDPDSIRSKLEGMIANHEVMSDLVVLGHLSDGQMELGFNIEAQYLR